MIEALPPIAWIVAEIAAHGAMSVEHFVLVPKPPYESAEPVITSYERWLRMPTESGDAPRSPLRTPNEPPCGT